MTLKDVHLAKAYFAFWQNGKEEGFSYFFKAYYPALVVFATGIVKEKEIARDIVQDSLIKLWRKRPNIQGSASLRSYFYRTVHNGCLNYLKAERRRMEIQKTLKLKTEEASFFHGMVRAETLRHLYAAIKTLPPQCAKVVHMYYDEGKDYKTIAGELELSINTVRNQRKNGIGLLKKNFYRSFR
jgi:RNA polymerase sigma-70 factor (ECF subfamily)